MNNENEIMFKIKTEKKKKLNKNEENGPNKINWKGSITFSWLSYIRSQGTLLKNSIKLDCLKSSLFTIKFVNNKNKENTLFLKNKLE